MTNDLAKAEALFEGLKKKKKAELEAEQAAARGETVEAAPAPPEKTRRRVRIRDVSAIRPQASSPAPEAKAEEAPPDRVFRRQLSDTLRQLGRDGSSRNSSAGEQSDQPALRASVAPAVVNAFQVQISAPGVDPEGELSFVIEGDDIAQVASDALVRVAEYMSDKHPGVAWKMQSLERLPLALAPRT